jgi:hypothetical protein
MTSNLGESDGELSAMAVFMMLAGEPRPLMSWGGCCEQNRDVFDSCPCMSGRLSAVTDQHCVMRQKCGTAVALSVLLQWVQRKGKLS